MSGHSPKKSYIAICGKYELPIHFQDWWLDIVCGKDNWNVCLSQNKDGGFQGCLVYFQNRKGPLNFIKMPALTSYSGLWLHYPEKMVKPSSKYSFDKQVIQELVAQLPSHHFFYQQLHPALQNSLPFYWEGFQTSRRYSYILEDIKHTEQVYSQFKGSIRTAIKAAKKNYSIKESDSITDLLQLHRDKKDNPPYDLELFEQLYHQVQAKSQGKLFIAINSAQQPCAALYLVWDTHCAYFLSSVRHSDRAEHHVMAYLIWEAIQFAATKVNRFDFDFEGSIHPGIEHFFREFGGTLQPIIKLSKTSNLLFHLISKWRKLEYG